MVSVEGIGAETVEFVTATRRNRAFSSAGHQGAQIPPVGERRQSRLGIDKLFGGFLPSGLDPVSRSSAAISCFIRMRSGMIGAKFAAAEGMFGAQCAQTFDAVRMRSPVTERMDVLGFIVASSLRGSSCVLEVPDLLIEIH